MNKRLVFEIDSTIFVKFPDHRHVVIVCTDLDVRNLHLSSTEFLKAQIDICSSVILKSVQRLDNRLVVWRDAFKSLGIKPNEFRPSINALVRRIMNNKPLGTINPITVTVKVISPTHILLIGAHPIPHNTRHALLTHADSMQTEGSNLGEVVLSDSGFIASRKWIWRQIERSKTPKDTTDVFLKIDGLDCIGDGALKNAIKQTVAVVRKLFSLTAEPYILSRYNPKTEVLVS